MNLLWDGPKHSDPSNSQAEEECWQLMDINTDSIGPDSNSLVLQEIWCCTGGRAKTESVLQLWHNGLTQLISP